MKPKDLGLVKGSFSVFTRVSQTINPAHKRALIKVGEAVRSGARTIREASERSGVGIAAAGRIIREIKRLGLVSGRFEGHKTWPEKIELVREELRKGGTNREVAERCKVDWKVVRDVLIDLQDNGECRECRCPKVRGHHGICLGKPRRERRGE